MLEKSKVACLLQSMPDQFTAEELYEKLMLIANVEAGLQDFAEGRYYTTAQMKEIFNRWL